MSADETICEFGFPGPLRDRLVAAVLQGSKTATSSLLTEWEQDGDALPFAGERQTVIDSAGAPVAVIEIVSATVVALGDVDLQVALDEGEGFESVADWRSAHERYWNEQVKPVLADTSAWPLTDDTPVVVERFRVVERFAD